MTHSTHKESAVSPHGERDVGKDPFCPPRIVVLILRNAEERTRSTARTPANAKLGNSPLARTNAVHGKSLSPEPRSPWKSPAQTGR